MSSVLAANSLGASLAEDAINGIYKITCCRLCGGYSVYTPAATCPHCGCSLMGPSAGISLYDGDVIYCDVGFSTGPQLSSEQQRRSQVSAYDVVDQRILSLLRNNRNWFGGVCGETGTGKSYASLRIGEMVDSKFEIGKVAFNVIELLELIQNVSAKELILFDEAEAWNARRSMKSENVVMGEIMSMLRFTQINIACTMPDLEMIDINARRLMHDYLRTQYIERDKALDWKKDKSAVDWYVIKKSKIPLNDKSSLYFARPIITYLDHINNVKRREKCGTVYLNSPDPTLLEEYEKRKDNKFRVKLRDVLVLFNKIKKDLPQPEGSEGAKINSSSLSCRGHPSKTPHNVDLNVRAILQSLGI